MVARGREGSMRTFKGGYFSWFSGSLAEIKTEYLHGALSRSLKDSFHSDIFWLLSSEGNFPLPT